MKRYLLFTNVRYYPMGGMEDFNSDHDTIEEAKAAEQVWRDKYDPTYPEAHIFDTEARFIVLARCDQLESEIGEWYDPKADIV